MSETTSTISPPAKTTPPFHVGDYVEFRGWRGLLEAGISPFGASGRERLAVTDDCGIEYWHDRATDILFSSPRFSQDSLDHSYQQPTAHIDTRHFVGFDRRAWEQRADRSFIVNRLKVDLASRWLTPGSRILDVGCHVGLFVMLAQEAGFDCRGIDISADAIKIGADHLGIAGLSVGTLEGTGFEPESFDCLMIWDVLEHVYNLMEVMKRCAAVLRPGGYFFAQVPNHRGVSARLKTLACKLCLRHGRFHHFGFPWHLYHFSRRSLDLLTRGVGLATIQVRSFSHRSKTGAVGRGAPRWLNRAIEHLALSDYLYIVARKRAAP